ncbi:hypothetical protein [Bdellovibrio sp. GT3]|uniref:hypothetical protein n=1 Tax=unclassified Bdellovibrio TaxID=2633795 RepID=UPI0030F3283C
MIRILVVSLSSVFLLSACASGTFKARQEQRDKLAANTGMYCNFVSGEQFPDIEVELSMEMAKRCDSSRAFSITNFKNSSNENGVVYCCSMSGRAQTAVNKRTEARAASEKKDSGAEVVEAAP